VIDHDQYVIVREIAPDRILDPVASRVTAKQDDLEDMAIAIAGLGPEQDRIGKAVTNDLDDMRKLAALWPAAGSGRDRRGISSPR